MIPGCARSTSRRASPASSSSRLTSCSEAFVRSCSFLRYSARTASVSPAVRSCSAFTFSSWSLKASISFMSACAFSSGTPAVRCRPASI